MNRLNSNPEKQLSLNDYFEILLRRKWWLMIPVIVSIGIGVALVFYLPKFYRSSTLILVEGQKVPEDYVKSSVSGSIEDRLATIRQQILSRSLLQQVITDLGLYKKELSQFSSEEVLEKMRKNIEIKTDSTRKTIDAFTISFEGRDPKTVMEVTNKLATVYIEENLKSREQLVQGTTDFLQKELENLKVSLDRQEQNISDHKKRFMGSLPEQLDANLRSLDRYQMELQTISTSLMVAEEKRKSLEVKISGLEGRLKESGVQGVPDENAATNTSANPIDEDLSTLAKMKKNLETLRQEYTDAYPDIVILKRKIKELDDSVSHKLSVQKQQERSRPKNRSRETLDSSLYSGKGGNTEYQRQMEDLNNEILTLKDREESVNRNILQLEKAVEQTPMREQQMEGILRDYENTKKAYQALLDKKLNADLSENLEKRQKGEQFRIVDPAIKAEKPFKPEPAKLIMICLGAGLGIGVGLVLLIEAVDTSFKKPEEIEVELGLPVLVVVPQFESKKKIYSVYELKNKK